jgi:flagellar hook-associated protein 2
MSSGSVTAQQIQQTVQQSLQIELAKIGLIRDDKNSLEDKKLAYNNIDNAIESLEDSLQTLTRKSAFSTRKASSSNDDLVSATASTSAAKTSFTFSSITKLASAARVTSETALGLLEGSAPFLSGTASLNGGDDFQNIPISDSATHTLSPQIVSGTFSINSSNVKITANDTLYTILSKINNAGAGVVATFDEDTDTVRISGTSVGANKELTFDSRGTNFFEAVNLSAAEALTAGEDAEKNQIFDEIASGSLATVKNGFFNINNHTFQVNTAVDSLQRLINRVNSSNAGAVMFYDDDTGKVTLTHQETGEPLVLENDTSDFLKSIGLLDAEGDQNATDGRSRYVGEKAEFVLNGQTVEKDSNVFTIGGVTFSLTGTTSAENPSATITVESSPKDTLKHVQNYVSQFNATMSVLKKAIDEDGGALERDPVLRRLMTRLRTQALRSIENPGQYGSLGDIGLSFNRGGGIFTLTLDEETLRSALDTDETSVQQLFAFSTDNDGLLDDGGYAYTTREELRGYTRAVSGFFYKEIDQIDKNMERLGLKIYDKEQKLIKQEKRMFDRLVNSIMALQKLQEQGSKVNQINSIVMSSLAGQASNVFSASLA